MNGIFINYRREDSSGYAGRLYDSLIKEFGNDRIFFDVDAIAVGEDFREVIQKSLSSCGAVLVVIGRQWANIRDKAGRARLESETDFVRQEIASALQKRLAVIPVLVGGAEMPPERVLPPELKVLAFRQNWEVSDRRFHEDVKKLVDALKEILSRASQTVSNSSCPPNLPIITREGLAELEKDRQKGGNLLIMPDRVAVVTTSVEPVEERSHESYITVLANMRAGARYEYYYGDFQSNILATANLLATFAMTGLIHSTVSSRDRLTVIQENANAVRANLQLMRRGLSVHFRRRPPLQFSVHNPLSEDAAVCYLRHREGCFVRWAEHREAAEIAQELMASCTTPAPGGYIFHSTFDFRLSEDRVLDDAANAIIRNRRETLLQLVKKQFPPEFAEELYEVCLGT